MSHIQADKELDCRKLNCPLPVLRTRQAIESMAPGQVLKMVSDLPGSVRCLPIWSRKSGHAILEVEQEGPVYTYYIRRK